MAAIQAAPSVSVNRTSDEHNEGGAAEKSDPDLPEHKKESKPQSEVAVGMDKGDAT